MFLFLNRFPRGTYSLGAKFNGVVLGLLTYLVFHNYYVAIAVAFGYVLGENFGWGLWLGSVSERVDGYSLYLKGEREGANNGIHWLASHIIEPTKETWLNYCRVALTIRGFYWWLPTLAPLYFVGFNPLVLLGCILFLSVCFPIACEIGYLLRDKISFGKYGLEFRGGWELQEGAYGLMQDLVLITLGVSYVIL